MYKNEVQFWKDNVQPNEKGVAHVSKKTYTKFMDEMCGLPEAVLKSVSDGNTKLVNSLYQYNAERLIDAAQEAKKDGGDPAKTEVKTTVATMDGQMEIRSQAAKKYPIPNKSDTVTKTMVTSVNISFNKLISPDLCEGYEKKMSKICGL